MSLPWRDNWNAFGELKREGNDIRRWFFERYLGGDNTLYALITAGPLTAPAFIEGLANEERQFEAGWPVRVRIAAVNCEPIFCEKRADEVKPMRRVYQYLIPWKRLHDGWDPDLPNVQALKRKLEQTFARIKEAHPYIEQDEVNYLDPNSKKFWKLLGRLGKHRMEARRKSGRRRFDMLLSGPNGYWIERRLRKATGEIASPNVEGITTKKDKDKLKLKLHELEVLRVLCRTFGMCWGFHPMRPERSAFGYTAYAGKDVVRQMLEDRLTHARGALMGLGPWVMDDPTLLEVIGPKTALGIEYPPRKRTQEEKHLEGAEVVEWIPKQVPLCLFGDGTDRGNLGDAIAGRILVLYHAHKQGLI